MTLVGAADFGLVVEGIRATQHEEDGKGRSRSAVAMLCKYKLKMHILDKMWVICVK